MTEWGFKTPGWTFWSDLFLKARPLRALVTTQPYRLAHPAQPQSRRYRRLSTLLLNKISLPASTRTRKFVSSILYKRICDCNVVKNTLQSYDNVVKNTLQGLNFFQSYEMVSHCRNPDSKPCISTDEERQNAP